MINFKQHLAESLSSSYPLRRGRPTHEFYATYHFDDDKRNYRITMADEYESTVEVIFSSEGDTHVLRNGSNALRVYATIGKAIDDFVNHNPKIKFVKFSAVDPRTMSVYDKLAKRIASRYKGSIESYGDEWVIKVR